MLGGLVEPSGCWRNTSSHLLHLGFQILEICVGFSWLSRNLMFNMELHGAVILHCLHIDIGVYHAIWCLLKLSHNYLLLYFVLLIILWCSQPFPSSFKCAIWSLPLVQIEEMCWRTKASAVPVIPDSEGNIMVLFSVVHYSHLESQHAKEILLCCFLTR